MVFGQVNEFFPLDRRDMKYYNMICYSRLKSNKSIFAGVLELADRYG